MSAPRSAGAAARRALPLLLAGLLAAGCASSGTAASPARPAASPASSAASSDSAGMSGMDMGGGGGGMAADGITPVPTQVLGSAEWQGMRITAKAMTAVPFVIYNGGSEQVVKPGPKDTFHLMVLLNDAQTGVAIPYASVWATITENSKIALDERLWPMISRYMGPHYGVDVSLPGSGTYQLTLLVSPPVSARHLEYQHVWLKPHRVSFTFDWKAAS